MSYKITFIEGPPELYGINGSQNHITVQDINPEHSNGIDGDFHINNKTKKLFKKEDGQWKYQKLISSNDGNVIHGLGQPYMITDHTKGDIYIDRLDANYYLAVKQGWILQGNLLETFVVPNKQILTGNGPPNNAIGMDGDQYIDNVTKNYYIKELGVWNLQGNLQGPPGQPGSQILTGNGSPLNTLGEDGDYYINNINKEYYLKIGGVWVLQGSIGPQTTFILTGNGAPNNALGNNGDTYINNITKDYYIKQAGIWILQGNLQGQPGVPGVEGNQILTGNGVPLNTLGQDGDYYINNLNGDYYLKAGGLWGLPVGNLTGPVGSPGLDGSKILTGVGVPLNTLGQDGDYYIDIATDNYYLKVGGVWGPQGSLQGPIGEPGIDGSQILTGDGVPLNTIGQDGDYYIDNLTGDYYLKVGGIWQLQGSLRGQDGSQIFTGNGVPLNTLGQDGDYYIDNLTGNYYIKSGGVWGAPVGNLVGPIGDQGQSGSQILTGNGVPLNTLGQDGDYYIDNLTGTYYLKEIGVWQSQGSLKGPQGPMGGGGFPPDEIFGDGSLGDFIFPTDSVFTADRYYNNATINDVRTINTNGYRIFVKEILDISGFLGVPTRNAVQFNPGAGSNAGTLGFGASGGTGSQTPISPSAGSASLNTPRAGFFNGGGGGSNNSPTPSINGSPAGATTPVPITDGSDGPLRNLLEMVDVRSLSGVKYNGGSGGGAGPGVTFEFNNYYGGGGGGGGGVVAVFAKVIRSIGVQGLIGAQGGNGANGQSAGASIYRGGGGGGGGGGVLVYITTSLVGTSISAASVQGGTAGGSGVTRGTDGEPGIIYGFIVTTV